MADRIEYRRTLPARRPEGFTPAAPKFEAQWSRPVATLVAEYIALQYRVDGIGPQAADALEADWYERLRTDFEHGHGPDCVQRLRQPDRAGTTDAIAVAYWTDVTRHARWLLDAPFNDWFASAQRARDGVGYWRERLVIPRDRAETIFSESFHPEGWAATPGCELQPMDHTGYFGAMRDRIPLSAIDPLDSPYGERVPSVVDPAVSSEGRRIRVTPPLNLVCIRSGQYWGRSEGEQREDYHSRLQPKLETGMAYLKAHSELSGCLSLRDLVHFDSQGAPLEATSKLGHFLSLGHLERWAESHQSHLDIYRHALAKRREYGSARSIVTWHEVAVLLSNPAFEYLNCDPGTGLLRFAGLWGATS